MTVGCGSAPTDHLGGIAPADVVDIALAAGLTCAPAADLQDGDVYRTQCGSLDDGKVSFGGSTTDTVSSISTSPPLFAPPGTELDLADAVAELGYEGGDADALKEWIRTQAAGITNDPQRDFGPARAIFVAVANVLVLESVGNSG